MNVGAATTLTASSTPNTYELTIDANEGEMPVVSGWEVEGVYTVYGGSLSGDIVSQLDTTNLVNVVYNISVTDSLNVPNTISDKKLIIIGDRDGVPGYAIDAVLADSDNTIVDTFNTCFECTAAGAMDLDAQQAIIDAVDEYGAEDVIVILGGHHVGGVEIFAQTVTTGDPTGAGPLYDVALHLPVYHIFEQEVVSISSADVWDEYISNAESSPDIEYSTGPTATKNITYNTAYGTGGALPTPTRIGNEFVGWYPNQDGTVQK